MLSMRRSRSAEARAGVYRRLADGVLAGWNGSDVGCFSRGSVSRLPPASPLFCRPELCAAGRGGASGTAGTSGAGRTGSSHVPTRLPTVNQHRQALCTHRLPHFSVSVAWTAHSRASPHPLVRYRHFRPPRFLRTHTDGVLTANLVFGQSARSHYGLRNCGSASSVVACWQEPRLRMAHICGGLATRSGGYPPSCA